ncbi:MAG: RnfH family protein [Paludibacterium sp.]|uniref:RnfH family protein n=1 Tax=Paludibacterium sp. TaxID=1917523 RepID=UPI0025CCFFF7|nr:RnfH family protein [Paludibacterium sp.]MBV8047658.1 RnfH family protein [Paludibacterium sp.]MBV8648393.1 RnfH family protein [Paludibacterium sp.]
MTEAIEVEVAYATPQQQRLLALTVPQGTRALEAAERSGLLAEFAVPLPPRLGVFGKAVPADYVLRAGDRVEIYRPLLADPKEVRRRRARAAKD